MALKLFECQEQIMIDKLTQFEKTGSIGNVFYCPRKSEN